jgi:hypothetical protein
MIKRFLGLLILLLISDSLIAQDIEVTVHDTNLQDTLGADIAFHFEVVNISNQVQNVFLVRTINSLPDPNWTSSLCFGENCFAPSIDSVITAPPFPEPPVNPGDTLKASVHVFPLSVDGTANVQVQIGTESSPNDRTTINVTAIVLPTSVGEDGYHQSNYFISQNYPNPFNPSTKIKYGIGEAGVVSIKVYNILGVEVASLVKEYKTAGSYAVDFSNTNLSSGVYLYSLTVNNYSETRKMILKK